MLQEAQNQLTETDLNNLEAEIGYSLPENLKQFYLESNGGIPANAKYSWGIDLVWPFHKFLPIKYGEMTIEKVQNEQLFKNASFGHMLPIAVNKSDHLFCICLREEGYGSIYVWDNSKFNKKSEFLLHCKDFNEFIVGFSTKFV